METIIEELKYDMGRLIGEGKFEEARLLDYIISRAKEGLTPDIEEKIKKLEELRYDKISKIKKLFGVEVEEKQPLSLEEFRVSGIIPEEEFFKCRHYLRVAKGLDNIIMFRAPALQGSKIVITWVEDIGAFFMIQSFDIMFIPWSSATCVNAVKKYFKVRGYRVEEYGY